MNLPEHYLKAVMVPLMASVLAFMFPFANAQQCNAPSNDKQLKVEKYVISKYKLSSLADVILTEAKQANDACFWLLKFEASSPKREIAVYLSPDGNYLTPELNDTRIDPQIEENRIRKQNADSLLVGISPEVGRKDAPVTIALFSDFECPYCKRFAEMLEKDYLPQEKNHIRLLFKNYPLPMHPWAMAAAEMAECVTLQKPEEFWKVHDFLFQSQSQLTAANLKDTVARFVAANIAIDQEQYRLCVDNNLAMGLVRKDADLGQKLGVKGTPSIFINGVFYSGAKDASQLRSLVEEAMNGGGRSVPFLPVGTQGKGQPSGRNSCGGEPLAQSKR